MKYLFPVLICAFLAYSGFAQSSSQPAKKNPRSAPAVQQPTPESTPAAPEPKPTPSKKNERPGPQNDKRNNAPAYVPTYFYEFSQPNFHVSKVMIEHDENGIGKISILKKDWQDPDSDSLRISESTLARIRAAYEALDFLNSTESYQYVRDYQHLGNNTFRLIRGSKQRETTFNWTENKDAKALMDAYRGISNQYVWIFDMNVARTNQPLDAPNLMDAAEGYIARGDFSDPVQMIPYLKEVSLDERIPLIARNHAKRLIERIESKK